jgi:hypothetical protein
MRKAAIIFWLVVAALSVGAIAYVFSKDAVIGWFLVGFLVILAAAVAYANFTNKANQTGEPSDRKKKWHMAHVAGAVPREPKN